MTSISPSPLGMQHVFEPPSNIFASANARDCINGPLKDNLVCNFTANYADRAKALVDLWTVEELIANMGNTSPGVSRLGLPAYEWWSEALHGVAHSPGVSFNKSGHWRHSTSFPQPILLGASFDDDLVHRVATIISTEARAFHNGGHAGVDFWTPNINPFRDPRWGRGQETPGEDALHISRYVYALVTAFQGPDAPNSYKVVANCKHFAGYDLDDWAVTGIDRFHFDAQITLQELAEYHMPPFRSCVRDAKAGSVMCSYNSVNGVPSCANPYLLQDILRDSWDFGDGWVTGDCDAILHIWQSHRYAGFLETAAIALKAGTDLDCGRFNVGALQGAYKANLITHDDLKLAMTRLYGSLIRTGYFDPADSQPYGHLGWRDVNTRQAQKLALEAAEAGIVLLKNDGLLPISRKQYRKLLVTGPWADATQRMQGNYFGEAPYIVSPLQGLRDAGFSVSYHADTYGVEGNTTDAFGDAVRAAESVDLVIFFGGIDNDIEREAKDRVEIAWPSIQLSLMLELASIGKPFIVVQFGGGQVDDTELKENRAVNALLWAGYPGQSGGTAIANIITGVSAPAGRLPITQYPASYSDHPMTDMSLRPTKSSPGRTYRWYTGTPVYEFGHGLHYTTFQLSWNGKPPKILQTTATQRLAKHADNDILFSLSFTVTNTGKVTSDYVAMLYGKTDSGPQPAPLKSLIGYVRAKKVAPGSSVDLDLRVTVGAISRVDEKGSLVLYPGKWELWFDSDAKLRTNLLLNGPEFEVLPFPQPR